MRTMIDLEDSQASNLDAWAKVEKSAAQKLYAAPSI